MVFLAGSFLLNSCTNPGKKAVIVPPVKGIDIPYISKQVNPKEDSKITFSSGTSVVIPANAFVDANNKPVTSPVNISFREFHDAVEIMMAGIPMTYDSAGTQYNFTTAGMFEINASSENNPVFIARDKEIQVNLASRINGIYNFYQLDTVTGQWKYMATSAPVKYDSAPVNENKTEDLKIADTEKPVPPRKAGKNTIIFDFKIDYSAFPELKEFEELLWEYLPAENTIKDPSKLEWVYNNKWDYMKLEPYPGTKGFYKLKLANNSNQFEAVIAPVLSGKDYKKAMEDFTVKMKNYNDKLQVRVDEMDRFENERSFVRSYSLKNFGIYNWDCIYTRQDFITCNVIFKIAGYQDLDISSLVLYHIADNSRAIVKYYPSGISKFAFSVRDKNKLVAFLPGNKIAVFTNEDFRNLFNQIATNDRQEAFTVSMRVKENKVNSMTDIIAAL